MKKTSNLKSFLFWVINEIIELFKMLISVLLRCTRHNIIEATYPAEVWLGCFFYSTQRLISRRCFSFRYNLIREKVEW